MSPLTGNLSGIAGASGTAETEGAAGVEGEGSEGAEGAEGVYPGGTQPENSIRTIKKMKNDFFPGSIDFSYVKEFNISIIL